MRSTEGLIKLALEGEQYREWYQQAEQEIRITCLHYGWCPTRFADILALTSPRTQVTRNWRVTKMYMRGEPMPKDVMRTTRAAIAHYEATGEIRGPKTSQFALALQGVPHAVVLDTWMAMALKCNIRFKPAEVRLEAERRVRLAARRLGWPAREFQAAVWCATVKRAGRSVPSMKEISS